MKNVIGKIFVFAVFAMSLMLMSFAIAIYSSHVNWQEKAKTTKADLDAVTQEKAALEQQITRLTKNVADSEAARDQVVAKFHKMLEEKEKELRDLKDKRDKKIAEMQKQVAELAVATDALKDAQTEVKDLQKEVDEKQAEVDKQVTRAAELAAKLQERESLYEIAKERKEQLEKQVSHARTLLQQNGLSLESAKKDVVPNISGVVTAVAEDAIEVSLGSDDGLQTGHPIAVYRNDAYLGRAVVRTVKADKAVAVLLREYSKGIIQRGDKVTTQLSAKL